MTTTIKAPNAHAHAHHTASAQAFPLASNMYTISSAEITAIENEVSNATHEACIALHAAQCDAVQRDCYTPAARVEMVLQLAKLSASIERAGFAQCRRIAGD
jgi:hypothetical protein